MFRPTGRSSSGLSSLVSGECYACGGPAVLYCWTALFWLWLTCSVALLNSSSVGFLVWLVGFH
jgi:hypothetical protein